MFLATRRGACFRSTGDPVGSPDAPAFIIGFCYYHRDDHDGSGHYFRFIDGSGPYGGDGEAGWQTGFADSFFLSVPRPLTTTPDPGDPGYLEFEVVRGETYHVRVTEAS